MLRSLRLCDVLYIDRSVSLVFLSCVFQVEALQTYYGVRVSVASSGRMYVFSN